MNMTSLIPWNRRSPTAWAAERDPFTLLHNEINRLFDTASRELGGAPLALDGFGGWPRVDVTDAEDHLRIDAEVPGLTEKDVEVTLKDGVLTLSGERKVEHDDSDRRVSERFVGRFARQIPLGYEIDEDNVTARFANGELTVTLPKTAQAQNQAKRIEIQSAA
ncbi:molecular chaperone Hsp20 [Roseovarius sp. A46]|uniref:Hsp20/alpha crystallin family protein n=1 Tax=Roseovarius sp. A46 TaxID=2109331 RepID=UPI001010422D|nr:Hsp20/alpha crystallin family protein [Roseovarius sp. A46]RXV61745.1 molecular chaperone Hsp20 [Roseovarius sp. A46]